MLIGFLVHLSLGLFLFLAGMTWICRSLKSHTDGLLQARLSRLTHRLPQALMLGFGLTALLQSSSAVMVMTVGLAEAGLLNLWQVLGIVMGANIGTTMTAQLLRLSLPESAAHFWQICRPEYFAYALLPLSLFCFLFSRCAKSRFACQILSGLALLFIGMHTMEAAASHLNDTSFFTKLFTRTSYPPAGIGIGVLSTALLQSSSLCIGILQALSTSGSMTWASAVPLLLGQNIGTSATALLASLGRSPSAKQAALLHLYFNLSGVLLFSIILYGLPAASLPWQHPVTKGDIANFHTFFNCATTLFLLPFCSFLIRLVKRPFSSSEKSDVGFMNEF